MNSHRIFLLACLAALPAAAQIPVHCGDSLNIPGGQYVLTGNLTCPSVPAVHVTADNVSFDLQGFTLSKSGPAVGTAITTAAGPACVIATGATISNGTISGFGIGVSICVPTGPGVSSASTQAVIHHLNLTGNSTGIALYNANDNEIHHNTVNGNTGTAGITPGMGIVLVNSSGNNLHQNEASGNGADGVALMFGSKDNNVMHNVAKNNTGSGINVTSGSGDNVLKMNEATTNGSFDLKDGNAACGTNLWRSNTFVTKSQPCIN